MNKQQALKRIKEIHEASKSRYGSPKITYELNKKVFLYPGLEWLDGPRCKLCRRSMRKAGIRSIVHKQFRICTTDSNHNYPVAKNLLNRYFIPENIGKAWVSDLTYIIMKEGWLYLTVIVDSADRKVVGWALSLTMKASETVILA